MINAVASWFRKSNQNFVEDADYRDGVNKTLLSVFEFEHGKIPVSLYINDVFGMHIFTADTRDLFPDICWADLPIDTRFEVCEWMLKDNDLNSLGNWGICPLGTIRFQVETSISQPEEVELLMETLKKLLAQLVSETKKLQAIMAADPAH
jgi:hypothetical protein